MGIKKILSSTVFLAILTCAFWASSFVPTKVGLGYYPEPLQFAGYTFILAGVFLLPFAKVNRHFFLQLKDHFRLFLKVGFFSTTLLYGAYYTGQNLADASVIALIVGSQPFFVALMAHCILKNEKFTPLKIISIIIAIAGLVIVSFPSFKNADMIGWGSAIGILLIIIDCLSASYGNIIVSQIDFSKVDIKVLNTAELTLGGIMLLILSFIIEGFKPLPAIMISDNYKFYLSLLAMVMITDITMVIWFKLIARPDTKVSELNMWKFLIPVIGSIESWLFISNDKPTLNSIIGLIVITLALLIFSFIPVLYEKKHRNHTKAIDN